MSPQAQAVVYDNCFDNNSALRAAALIVWGESTITKNRFQNHQGSETIFLPGFQGTFEGNTLVGNNTTTGIGIVNGIPPFPRFSNNIIARSGTNALAVGAMQASPLFAELEHNTLVGGGGGAAVQHPSEQLCDAFLDQQYYRRFSCRGGQQIALPPLPPLPPVILFSPRTSPTMGLTPISPNSLRGRSGL